MSSFSSLWPAGGLADGNHQGQQQDQQMQPSQELHPGHQESQLQSSFTGDFAALAQMGAQDQAFMGLFPELDQNVLMGAFGNVDGTGSGFDTDPILNPLLASTDVGLPSNFQHHSHLLPNFNTNHLSQPPSQQFQHAIPSQPQDLPSHSQQSSQQPQQQQQSDTQSQPLANQYLPHIPPPSQESHQRQQPEQHLQQPQQQQQHQQPSFFQQSNSTQHLQPAGHHQLGDIASQTDANGTSQLSFQAAAPGAFGVPAGLFGNQYPGLLYGAAGSGSQSTLADTSFDSIMFNSQEQSFSSLTSHTSQSVPGSQESRLGAVNSNASLKDSFFDAHTMPPPSHPADSSIGQRRPSGISGRHVSNSSPVPGSLLQGPSLPGRVDTEEINQLNSLDTPPQHTSFDNTVAADSRDDTQTTPQSNSTQQGTNHATNGTFASEEQSPSRFVAAAGGARPAGSDALGKPTEDISLQSFTRSTPAATTPASQQFLTPPAPQFTHQASQSHLQPPSSQWQGQGWMPANNMVGMGIDSTGFTAGVMQQPGNFSASPVNTQGSGLSPTGSSRSGFESAPVMGDRRVRSSTISVTPEVHVSQNDMRPRSSTSSAGSNIVNSFTPPAAHASGMSRTNSSVSLAVFQPLEQLHISGGRPGTAGSAQGSTSSQHSGQFTFQRPGSGGFPSVPQFGAPAGASNAGLGANGIYGQYGAVGPQQSALAGRFQRAESFVPLGPQHAGDGSMASPTGWQGPNRGGAGAPAGRKLGKLRRAPSNLTLDSSFSSNLSTNSFSPVSYGLPSANASDASPQFEHFPSVPSSASSSNALTAPSMTDYGQHSQHYPGNFGQHHFGGAQGFGAADAFGFGASGPGGASMSDASQLGLGAPPSSSVSNKATGSGYQTPTIIEEDESRAMQGVLSMGLIPAQLVPTTNSANVTPSMPSSGWTQGMVLDFMGSADLSSSFASSQAVSTPSAGPGSGAVGGLAAVFQHRNTSGSRANSSTGLSAGGRPQQDNGELQTLSQPQPQSQSQSHSQLHSPAVSSPGSSAQRSGPSVIIRYGGTRANSADTATGSSGSDLEIQPSTLHHAVPISMASKYGPSGIPPALSASFHHWTEYKQYLRDQVCEYLATPSRLGLGERTVTIMTGKVGPKSYGTEKRFLCPPPLVMLSGSSWWSADPNKLLAQSEADASGGDKADASQRKRTRMSVLAPPIVSVKMLSEGNSCDGGLQWASSDGRLIEGKAGLKNKIPVAGRSLARQIYLSEGLDDKKRPVYVHVNVSLPGPQAPIELGSFLSGPIKVISKASRKRQGAKNTELSIMHGSTVSLFHRLRAQSLSTRFLCVSGPPTWIKGSDNRPFLKSSISNHQTPAADQNASFIVKTASWDSFVIYAVDPLISSDAVSQQAPLNPRYPPPPASARPLRVDGESSVPILYNQPVVLQCVNTGVTSPIMTIRAVENNKVALGGLPTCAKGPQPGYMPEMAGEPVSHNHRIALEILDENGDNSVEPLIEGNPNCTPGRSGQFLACLQDAVGLRLCGPRRWLPHPPSGEWLTDADQPRSATPMQGTGSTTTQAAFIAAVAAAQTRHSLAQSRSGNMHMQGQAGNGPPAPVAGPSSAAAVAVAAHDRPDSSDGGKVKRPRRVSSSAVVPKDRASGPGRGRRRGQSLSTVGMGLHDPVEPHLRTSASSTNLRAATSTVEGHSIAVGPGCRWLIDVAESDIWSIIGTEQVHHTFYIPPAIQNAYLPPSVDLGPELSHLVRTPTPSRQITPLPVLTNWSFSTTAHLGAGFDPGRETVELHGESLSQNYFVFFGDWESEVLDATSWRLICTPPPMWDESGVRRSELPVTLVRDDGIIIPTSITLALNPAGGQTESAVQHRLGPNSFQPQGVPGPFPGFGVNAKGNASGGPGARLQ